MWFFRCPEIYFGEDAVSQLEHLHGHRAFIVTDAGIIAAGLHETVISRLSSAGLETHVFSTVEPNPSLQTVRQGAEAMMAFAPDWIIGLGGGSSMDAARAMWILYERPDISPDAINPLDELGLRQKAQLIAIPTTAGSGAEVSYGIVLTDLEENRKLTLGSAEALPDMAIVDPYFTTNLPRQLTADTGIDVLSHAIEGFSSVWANDFTDGLCLQAARLVFDYLPRAVLNGPQDVEAREKMANAATIAGLALGNSQVALAHALGHSAGAMFKQIPHGRITAVFLPYTIEYVANAGVGRYRDLALTLGLAANDEAEAASNLARAVRDLMRAIELPASLSAAGVALADFEEALPLMVDHVEVDVNTLMSRRVPGNEDVTRLFQAAYDGGTVNF